MPRATRRRRVALAVLALASCTSSATGAKATGELGNGTFDYFCTGASDPVCEGGAPATDFPDCLLLGGRFEMGYTAYDLDELHGWGYEFVYVKPASESFFGGLDGLTALRLGTSAFVAYADDNVIDILHVTTVAPDGIILKGAESTDPVDLVEVEVGSAVSIQAFGSSTACAQVGGAVPVTVESSDSAVARAGTDDGVQISGEAEGTATITVHLGELSREVQVVVIPAATTTDTDSSAETETGATETNATETGATETGATETGATTGDSSGDATGSSGTGSDSGTGTGTGG